MGPIRGEVFGADRLAKHARNIARKHKLLPPQKQRGHGPLLERLDDTRKVLSEVHDRLSAAAERQVDISPAGDWLLDNSYIVQEHIREIRTNLPGGYYQELPKLANGTLAQYPRVYDVAIELIAHTEGHISLENITLFVREYQKVASTVDGRAVGDSDDAAARPWSRTSADVDASRGATRRSRAGGQTRCADNGGEQ